MNSKILLFLVTASSFLYWNPLLSFENCNDKNTFLTRGNIENLRKSWNKIIDSNHKQPNQLISEVNKFKDTNGIPIYSFKGKFLPKNYIEYMEPLCGSELITFEKNLSKTTKLNLNIVYEISDNGKIVNTWKIPLNTLILGISKNSLFVEYEVNKLCYFDPLFEKFIMKIQENGNFEIIRKNKRLLEEIDKNFDCKNVKINLESQYRQCKIIKDMNTLKDRRLIFDGTCT